MQHIWVSRGILKGWIESGLFSRSNIVVARFLGYAEHKCTMYLSPRSNIKGSNTGRVMFQIEYYLGQHTRIGWAQYIDHRIKYILDIWYYVTKEMVFKKLWYIFWQTRRCSVYFIGHLEMSCKAIHVRQVRVSCSYKVKSLTLILRNVWAGYTDLSHVNCLTVHFKRTNKINLSSSGPAGMVHSRIYLT